MWTRKNPNRKKRITWCVDLSLVHLDFSSETITQKHVQIWSLFVDSPLLSTYISIPTCFVQCFFFLIWFSKVYLTQRRVRSSSQTFVYMIHQSVQNWCHNEGLDSSRTILHINHWLDVLFLSSFFFLWWIISLRLAINRTSCILSF